MELPCAACNGSHILRKVRLSPDCTVNRRSCSSPSVLPGIAFSLDLIETTNQYGVAEVLLSSFMAAFIFSVFGAQPLCIAGVTGPITVFNKTIFEIIVTGADRNPPNYLHFMGWVYLWAAILHWITAVLNGEILPQSL